MRKIALFSCIVTATILFAPAFAQKSYHGKKILYVNSYHRGYYWSDGEEDGFIRALKDTGVEIKVAYMDTKNHPSPDFSRQAGVRVKELADEFRPDVLVVADDNAFKDVVMAHYREAPLPVVFCGINWDVSVYGGPYTNTTGMLEVSLIDSTFKHLKRHAKGTRVGFLAFDSAGEHKNADYYPPFFKDAVFEMAFVKDFASWKRKFLDFQESADMLYIASPDGIQDWNMQEAQQFVCEHARIPIGADAAPAIAPLVLLGAMKVPEEQGEYAAHAALRILGGEKPASIPIAKNRRGDLYINLKIAEKLGVIFSPTMLRNAKEIIGKKGTVPAL